MIRNYFHLIIFLILANTVVNAQVDSAQQLLFNQIYSAAEKEYGIRQELINGLLFERKNQDAIGHPYFFLDISTNQGSAMYRGKRYTNLDLRYDIYDQRLLLIYTFNNLRYKVYLQKEFITEFNIGNKKFINEAFGENEDKKFYQVIGEDFPIKILYYWQKGLSNLYINNSDIKEFSVEQKKTFVLLNNKLVSFNRNRSFIRKFSSKSRTSIKKYFRRNKVKVTKANDEEMEQLIAFINTLDI